MNGKATKARNGAVKLSRTKADVIDAALVTAARAAGERVLRSLMNAKRFATHATALKFAESARRNAREFLDCVVVWAGKLAGQQGFVRDMADRWMGDAAALADPEHAEMLPEARKLLDDIAGWSVDDPEVVADSGITPTPPSPIEGEGVLPRAMAAGAAGVAA